LRRRNHELQLKHAEYLVGFFHPKLF
jgi:hypothetical protein